ncbi:MAG TPA: TlpA disulfide reductase family protein [Pyrinomonadaceae bacterium]|jgi:thiol-disulfide isomerase/thioredoxin
MLKALLLAGALLAPLALAPPRPAQKKAAPAKPEAAKPEAAKPGGAESPAAAARPKVSEINEAELKSLLGAGAGRARPLLINFWATWCTPCREEFPDLVKIRAQYGAERLDFVIVSLDDPSDIETAVPQFLSEVRAEGFASYILHAEDESVAINFVDPEWSGELPATFLYDRAGALVFKHKGRVKPAELRAALDEALKDRPQEAGARK